MASPLQQASTRRKLIYAGLMFVLFTGSAFGWRGLESAVGGKVPAWSVTAQAQALDLRELDRGQTADPTGELIRLTLTGSRGLAITLLWDDARELQEKHEWNLLERRVREIAKLQPHFFTPWHFLSWNLAYNVSVELDEPRDKYFYIARGIDLLAEGERLNKRNPDMRYWIGFYLRNKFGVSDEAATLRSLLQMSCMDPAEREPERLLFSAESGPEKEAEFRRFCEANPQLKYSADKAINPQAFAEFCRKHPQLVRRLRDYRHLDRSRRVTPRDIVDFLARNRKLPSRYYDSALGDSESRRGLKPADEQFPCLPPVRSGPGEAAPEDALDDSFDNYMAARAWFVYSLEPLPPPTTDQTKIYEFDATKYRLPRQPTVVVFRTAPQQCTTFVARRLQAEGWFDRSGWDIDEYRTDSRWFPRDLPVVAGEGRNWGVESWGQAYEAWKTHGEANGLYLSPEQISALNQRAEDYRRRTADRFQPVLSLPPDSLERERRKMAVQFNRPGVTADEADQAYRRTQIETQLGPDLSPEEQADPGLAESFQAHRMLVSRWQTLQVTNFEHFLFLADAERDPLTIEAHKQLAQARLLRLNGQFKPAIERYQAGLTLWKQVCLRYHSFRTDQNTQEDFYELLLPYITLLREDPVYQGERLLAQAQLGLVGQWAALGVAGASSPAAALACAYPLKADRHAAAIVSPSALPPPLDDVDAAGEPWIQQEVVIGVRVRRNLDKPPSGAAPSGTAAAVSPQIAPPPGQPGQNR